MLQLLPVSSAAWLSSSFLIFWGLFGSGGRVAGVNGSKRWGEVASNKWEGEDMVVSKRWGDDVGSRGCGGDEDVLLLLDVRRGCSVEDVSGVDLEELPEGLYDSG